MQYKVKNATIIIDKRPQTCGECFCYSEHQYQCMNERGTEANCTFGFMDGEDMRDKSFRKKIYPKCQLLEGDDNA